MGDKRVKRSVNETFVKRTSGSESGSESKPLLIKDLMLLNSKFKINVLTQYAKRPCVQTYRNAGQQEPQLLC